MSKLTTLFLAALLCAGSASAQIWGYQPSVAVDSTLIGWWPMSPYYNNTGRALNTSTAGINLSGLTMYDYSGTYTSSVVTTTQGNVTQTVWSTGPQNNATYTGLTSGTYYGTYGTNSPLSFARFGGSGAGYVAIPSISIPSSVTVSAWAVVSGAMTGSNARIVEWGNSSAGIFLGGDATNAHYLVSVGNYSGGYGTCSGGTIDTNWHLVTATYDGTNAYLFVDAIQVAGPCAFTLGTPSISTAIVGCNNGGTPCSAASTQAWGVGAASGGLIGGVRFNNTVVPRTSLITIYSSEAGGFLLRNATWTP